jgi:hypothetical protein
MIITQTPYRVSFAGGGTDLPAFYEHEPGAVLSVGVNHHMYVTVSPRFDKTTGSAYSKVEVAETIDAIEHTIAREALRMTGLGEHLEITTVGDVPAGTGHGLLLVARGGHPERALRLQGQGHLAPAHWPRRPARSRSTSWASPSAGRTSMPRPMAA